MKHPPLSRRRDYDLLRVASMVAVVYLHTAAAGMQTMGNTPLWQLSNVLAALATAAVPIFFMLSGALLLNSPRTEEPAFMLKHRLPKIVLPGLFWSGLVLLGTWAFLGGEAAFQKLIYVTSTTVITPYWFLYALVPMYLLSPLLKRMTDHLQPRHWTYLVALWAVLTLGLQSLTRLVPAPWNLFFLENSTYTVSAVGGYLGYFLLGAYLAGLKKIPSRRTLWLTAGADWAIMAVGTWYCSAQSGVYSQQFLDYRGLFTAVLAVCLFLLARSYCGAGKGSGRMLTLLSGCSFGVYLAHPLAIQAVELLLGERDTIPLQLATWLLALLGSILGVMVVQSIKPLCYLVTGQRFDTACEESNLFALLQARQPIDKP